MSAHTDSYGSDDYNFRLSDNRARSVMEYIPVKGIDPKRITLTAMVKPCRWLRMTRLKTVS